MGSPTSCVASTIPRMDVLVLIDKLDDLVHNAKAVPLTDQVRIDREEIYDILDQMRATIPEEIKQARWIVKERQEMLAEAKRECDRLIGEAREQALREASQTEIVKLAERQSQDIVEEARRVRKQLGGGMRQIGILAAAGLIALDTMTRRLAEDHENARLLADALQPCRSVKVAPVRTNIVIAEMVDPPGAAVNVVQELGRRQILASALDTRTIRLVTHHDVSRADCGHAGQVLAEILTER